MQQQAHMAGEFTNAASTTNQHCTCRYLFAALLPQRRLAVIAACNKPQATVALAVVVVSTVLRMRFHKKELGISFRACVRMYAYECACVCWCANTSGVFI